MNNLVGTVPVCLGKYDFAGKTVRKLGISFSSEKRTIVDVKVG